MKKGYIGLNSVISFPLVKQIEVMKPDGENIEVTVKRIVDEDGAMIWNLRRIQNRFYISIWDIHLEMYDILRRKE